MVANNSPESINQLELTKDNEGNLFLGCNCEKQITELEQQVKVLARAYKMQTHKLYKVNCSHRNEDCINDDQLTDYCYGCENYNYHAELDPIAVATSEIENEETK